MPRGVLIIAHGSARQSWSKELNLLLQQAGLPLPGKLAPHENGYVSTDFLAKELEEKLDQWLTLFLSKGCQEIKIIPLFVSQVSTHVVDLAEYCSQHSELSLGAALNAHPIIIKVLARDYAQLITNDQPAQTGVIVVGHGIREKKLRAAWANWAANLAEKLFLELNLNPELQRVTFASLHPDNLRLKASQYVTEGWLPVILPLFLSEGYYTRKVIPSKLEGLPHLLGAPYLPNPLVARWLEEQVNEFLD